MCHGMRGMGVHRGLGVRAGHRAGPWSELEGRVDVGFGCGNALQGTLDVSWEGCGRCAGVVAALLVGANQSRDGIDDARGLRLARDELLERRGADVRLRG